MIRPDRLTLKGQEAFRDAAAEASRRGLRRKPGSSVQLRCGRALSAMR